METVIDSYHSYPKVFALGHSMIQDLLLDNILVEEKIDGSQFSFGIFDSELKCRSKGKHLIIDEPEKMFTKAVETVIRLENILIDGWTYRAEYLAKPKHNSIEYSRIPKDNLILFDINTNNEQYLSYEDKRVEAERIDLEIVPIIYEGKMDKIEMLNEYLETESILGGSKIEGVVIKNYNRVGRDKKVLMGKYVSEAFKEVHEKEWKKSNPTNKDIIQMLGEKYHSEARWNKSIQHLKERGELDNSPKDIGNLLKEVKSDIINECKDEIKEALYKWAKEHILRRSIRGLPEWYKQELAKKQF